MNTQAVLFDTDGVILDSEPLHTQSRARCFKRLGISDDAEKEITIGASKTLYWTSIKQKYGLSAPVEELVQAEFDGITELVKELHVPESPNLSRLLAFLKDNGIKVGVGSASSRKYVTEILSHLGISRYFDVLVCGDEVKRPKPYPDTYLIGAEKLGATPAHCFVVEDSRTGSLAAQAAGIPCIGYKGTATAKNSDLSVCFRVVTDMKDIIDIIAAK